MRLKSRASAAVMLGLLALSSLAVASRKTTAANERGPFVVNFNDLGFDPNWERSGPVGGCFTYTANERFPTVGVRDIRGTAASWEAPDSGMKVIVCGNTAHFDHGFVEPTH